jgi:hypothetical protein
MAISFLTTFNLTPSTAEIDFTDTSTGIPAGNNGCFKIVSPSGDTIYDNTDFSAANCDIELNNGESASQQTITFTPELGTYTITYTIADQATGAVVYGTAIQTYDNEYVAPTVSIEQTVDCVAVLFGQEDVTNYVVNGVTPGTLTRTQKLIYPQGANGGSPPSSLTTSAATLSTATFFNGTQTGTVSTVLEYTFADGLTVQDTVYGSKEVKVDCTFICSIVCCIREYANRTIAARTANPYRYETEYRPKFGEIMGLVEMIDTMIKCGQADYVDQYITEVYNLTECTSDCDCGADANAQVTGFGTVVGINGTDGDSSYTYIAYASDASGTGFTTTFNSALNYIAIKTTTAAILSPAAADFAGLWKLYGASSGSTLLANNVTVDTPTDGIGLASYQTLKTYTLPAGTLANDGDSIEIDSFVVGASTGTFNAGIFVNGTISSVASGANLGAGQSKLIFKAFLVRTSATTVMYTYNRQIATSAPIVGNYTGYVASLAVNNLGTLTNTFSIRGASDPGTTTQAISLTIKKYNI